LELFRTGQSSTALTTEDSFSCAVERSVIKGWDQGLIGTKEGEKKNVLLQSLHTDAKDKDQSRRILTLVFEIEVLK